MKITKTQNSRLHALLTQRGLMDSKAELVEEYTQGRIVHSSEMTAGEAAGLIISLADGLHTPSPSQEGNAYPPAGNKIRRAIMSMAYTLEVINKSMSNTEKVAAIDEYVADHPKTGIKHKPLSEMTVAELQALHYQFERFLMSKLNK